MRQSDINVGNTYVNKGKGKTKRKVLAIGLEHNPYRCIGLLKNPESLKIGVLYSQNDCLHRALLSDFSAWAGTEVKKLVNDSGNSTV